jgi:DNA-binding response OmpR family regulator
VRHSEETGLLLVVEDEALIAVALQDDLEDRGYSVAGPFNTCAAALEWLTSGRPDVAVLDTVLKDGPCKDVALKLTSLGVPFVVYSGHSEDLELVGELDGAVWVEKPARGEVLLDAIARVRKGEVGAA